MALARGGTSEPSIRVAESGSMWSRLGQGSLLIAAVLAVILVPFCLFGDSLEALIVETLASNHRWSLIAALGVLTLAADVLLPVPSSLVATAFGAIFGAAAGTILSATGLTLGCGLGFALGRIGGRPYAERRLGPDYAALAGFLTRHGATVLVILRGVPVLAEASVIAAGVLAMPFRRFLAATVIANLGVSLVYASLGAAAVQGMAATAFLAAVILPALLLLVVLILRQAIARVRRGRLILGGSRLAQVIPSFSRTTRKTSPARTKPQLGQASADD